MRSRTSPTHRPWGRPLTGFVLFSLFSALLLAGCREHRDLPRIPQGILYDPQAGDSEQAYFEQSFGGRTAATLRLGPGWFEPEKGWGDGHERVAWTARAARLYFTRPLERQVDLVARAVPLLYAGAPRQTVTPWLNGRRLATVAMPSGWSELRIPLPAEALMSTVNILDLSFAYEAIPSKVGLGADDRALAAAFGEVAVVPRGEPLHQERSTVRRGPETRRQLVLRGEPIAVPLPPATRDEVDLGAVHPSQPDLRLALDLLTANGARQRIWVGPAESAAWHRFGLQVRQPGRPQPARLLLSREGPGTGFVEMAAPEVHALPHRERAGGPPDVFLYLIDTLRADAVGVYGSTRPTTPHIDSFSQDALVFTAARSPSSWTLPATTSILSGLYPSRHGVILAGDRLPAARGPWLPTLLSGMGYETLCISQWLLGGDPFGLDRGFRSFYFNVVQNGKTTSSGVRWFLWRHLLAREHPETPLFCYLHVVDPHALYRPGRRDQGFAEAQPGTLPLDSYNPYLFMQQGLGRNPADVRHLRGLYEGEVHAADRRFGAFLAQLRLFDLYDESLIILVGDHGEEFNEHGGFDHGRTLYEELLRVPLIVKLPRSWGLSGRIASPVSTLDIAPTILEIAGGPPPSPGFQGTSLLPAARGKGTPSPPLFAETHVDAVDLKAALLGTIKCIANATGIDRNSRPAPRFESFDLASDPHERRPLPAANPEALRCRRALAAWLAHPAEPGEHGPLASEDREKLRSLGYIH